MKIYHTRTLTTTKLKHYMVRMNFPRINQFQEDNLYRKERPVPSKKKTSHKKIYLRKNLRLKLLELNQGM